MPFRILVVFGFALLTGACKKEAISSVPKSESPFKLTAGIQDIMTLQIDPSADAIWESFGTIVTKEGAHEHKPATEEEWDRVRGHAIVLIEAANLLLMEGRRVTREGVMELEDHGTPGNLSADESQQAIDADRSTFVSFATALRDIGNEILKGIDAKNIDAIMEAGATLEHTCEGCHLKFWYPGQKIPRFPDEAPEVDAAPTR